VIALGQLGWSLRRIEATVYIRRETISGYLRAAGIPIRPAGGWGRLTPAKPDIEVVTDSAMDPEVITDSGRSPCRSRSASACGPSRKLIELGLSRGRNTMAIWQDLVDQHGLKAASRPTYHLSPRSSPCCLAQRPVAATADLCRGILSKHRLDKTERGVCASAFLAATDRRKSRAFVNRSIGCQAS
jgi:hypothetical protein